MEELCPKPPRRIGTAVVRQAALSPRVAPWGYYAQTISGSSTQVSPNTSCLAIWGPLSRAFFFPYHRVSSSLAATMGSDAQPKQRTRRS